MRGLPHVRPETMGGCTAHTRVYTRFPVKLQAGGVYKVRGRERLSILALNIKKPNPNPEVESPFGRIGWKNGDILSGKESCTLSSSSVPFPVFTQQLPRPETSCHRLLCHDEE